MGINEYQINLRRFLNSQTIFFDLYHKKIIDREQFLNLQKYLCNKYSIKPNSVYVYDSLDI